MTVNMDALKKPESNISECKDQKEKQPECSHSDDNAGKRELVSVINNGPKDESNETIPSLPVKDENVNAVTEKTDIEKENVSVPLTPCKCTLCDVIVTSPHSLTQHIRQHNVNNQTNTCRICRKTLSSASSLDRHMLVHSGERPFKCRVCNMAFTTNGNMHRHMRTHGEVAGESLEALNENKDIKPRNGLKRRYSSESDSSYSNTMDSGDNTQQPKDLICPVCGKTFLCKYGLQIHMDTHPNDPIRCPDCLVTSSDYSAHIKHQCLGKETAKGTSFPVGFHDLSFSEFSSGNFSLIAKAFCERSTRRPSSAFHKFECMKCSAAFPCGRALQMHEVTHGDKIGTYCSSCKCDFPNPTYLYAHQLKHRSAEHCWNEIKFNGKKNDSNKDDFLVLFGLKTSKCSPEADAHQIKEEHFENMSYFVFGKNINDDKSATVEESHDTNKQNVSSDFADIQSIISLTSKTPLMSCVRSSPAMASPASPPKVTSCALPESPPIADSAQASPETPSKEDDYTVTKEEPMQSNDLEVSFSEEIPSKRQKTAIVVQQSKSYSCHKCKYTSLDKGTLRRHLRTHNGERPFQCTICSYAFTTKANCERHVKKCHKITSKEDISCAMRYNPNMTETKDSDSQASDTAHLETVCKYCNVDFKNPRVLRHHLRSLNNSCSQKPFLCTVCKSGFSTKNNCMRHVAKQHPHLKEKPSEAVLTTASNNTPSNQETIPLSDSGNSCFSEEPLNLSVREGTSDMEMDISNKSELDSIEDIVNAAKGLVCLSEMPPPQVQPLDLVIQPLDLTTKPKKLSPDENVESDLVYMPPMHNNVQSLYFENSCSPHTDLIRTAMTSSPILPEEPYQSTMMTNYRTNQETIFPSTDRPFICKYCSSGFTLKSNMERHIKRKHPEYARPTRSRNYVSAVSLSNEKSSNGLAVSTQTRNALRFVLNNKALSSSNQELVAENLTVQPENEDAVPNMAGRKSENSDSNSSVQQSKDPENAVDLASISDVIDTANSQEFKQFLKENQTDAKTSEITKSKTKQKQPSNSTSVNIEKFISRKRNSYADSPNSIACPYCKRKFPWRSSLRRHVLTHTGQKPFKCPKCPIWFTTKSNCERHFGRKHKVNNDFGNRSVPERPFKCNLCTSSTFSTQGNLRKHFYLKHWTKTGSGRHHLSEFLSSAKDAPMEHESEKEEIHLPVTFNFRNKSGSPDSKLRTHSASNGIFYCCYICFKKSYTREECLDHLERCYSSHQNSAKDGPPEESNNCEKEANLNEEFSSICNIADNAQSKIACAFCSNVFSSREEFCIHMKAHIKKLENMPLRTVNNEKQDIGPNGLCTSSLLSARNTRSNSLLYLMQAGKVYNSAWNVSEWNGGENVAQNEDNTDLIQNLLGIRDPKMLDEIFDSADSAARLLGVEEV